MQEKVLVAMSGGVDSSVTAALLKEQGYFVAGGFMKNFSPESWNGVLETDCPWEQDFADVQAVCKKLGIECRSFNFEKEYRDKVIEYFFDEYRAGRTPNPDIMCNKEIKFKLFLEKALELGFDYIATGHYARIQRSEVRSQTSDNGNQTSAIRHPTSEFRLLKGLDPKKDQSYFLYSLNQDQLSRTIFPIGHLLKSEVRQLARKFGLPNAEKKDSQGLCFVGHINVREFLKQRIPERAGQIVNPSGRVIGEHRGAWYYTIGQRRGLGLGGGTPYYVMRKDVANNVLSVSPLNLRGEQGGLYSLTAQLNSVHWINSVPKFPLSCTAKIRYQQPNQECIVFPSPGLGRGRGEVEIQFNNPQFAIAPGQAIVFYDAETVLGGGIIT